MNRDEKRLIRVANWGGGTQSSAMIHMSMVGLLPKLDHVIFADTGDEPAPVMEWVRRFTPEIEAAGIPVHIIGPDDRLGGQQGRLSDNVIDYYRNTGRRISNIPLRTKSIGRVNAKGQPDENTGPIMRQCTADYKVKPIERFIKQEIVGCAKGRRWPRDVMVEQWFGMSLEEGHRMRYPENPHRQRFLYPLITERPTRRDGSILYMQEQGYGILPRSACTFCPFHDNSEWRWVRDNDPEGWRRALEVDEAIANGHPSIRAELYLHRDLVRLKDANIEEPDNGLDLFGDECMGVCRT